MNAKDVKAGERYRIRAWEDMAAEFRVDEHGYICCAYGFTPRMRSLCGTVIIAGPNTGRTDLKYVDAAGYISYYSISSDMIEPVEEEGAPPEESDIMSDDALSVFLFSE